MELDNLKTAVRTLERRLDATVELNWDIQKEMKFSHVRSALGWLSFVLWSEIAAEAVLVLGAFLADHIGTVRFALPAAVLQVGTFLLVVASVRQLVMIRRLDYAGPVVRMQRDLATLKVLRARTTQWILVLAPALGLPVMIVGMQGLFGVDLVQLFGLRWATINFAVGVALILILRWLAHRYRSRLADHLAGRSLSRAVDTANEVAAFEK